MLKPCPICQAPVKWCDFGGEKISGECCDNIDCTGCGVTFSYEDKTSDTLQEAQENNLKAFNTRTLPPEIQEVVEAAQEMSVSGEDFYDKARRVMDAVDAMEVSDE